MQDFTAHQEALAEYSRLLERDDLPTLDARSLAIAARCAERMYEQNQGMATVFTHVSVELSKAHAFLVMGSGAAASTSILTAMGVLTGGLAALTGQEIEKPEQQPAAEPWPEGAVH